MQGFYRGVDCCVIVYDITQSQTFHSVENWREDFLQTVRVEEREKIPIVLIGRKRVEWIFIEGYRE